MPRRRTQARDVRRVYLVCWWFAEFGGMERHVTELAKSLRIRNVDVTVFSEMPVPRRNQYRRELEQSGIEFIAPPLPRRLVTWWQHRFPALTAEAASPKRDAVSQAMGGGFLPRLLERNLRRRLRRETPDVVHVHGWRLSQWVATWCVSRGIPAVYTEHSTIADWGGPVAPNAPRLLEDVGDLACVSEAARRSLAAWMPSRSLSVHQHIIRTPGHKPLPKTTGTLRLITVARLRREKGLDILLRAVAKLRAEGVSLRVEIVGDGSMRSELAKLRDSLGLSRWVKMTGALNAAEIEAKLRHADIFVLASRTEALSLALLEAMAHGLAIAATAVGGIPEFIHHKHTGLLVPSESEEALAEAIGRLAADGDLRTRLGKSARQFLEATEHSESAAVERVLASYERARTSVSAN